MVILLLYRKLYTNLLGNDSRYLNMAIANHSQEGRDCVRETFIGIVDGFFGSDGRDLHICQSFKWIACKS